MGCLDAFSVAFSSSESLGSDFAVVVAGLGLGLAGSVDMAVVRRPFAGCRRRLADRNLTPRPRTAAGFGTAAEA